MFDMMIVAQSLVYVLIWILFVMIVVLAGVLLFYGVPYYAGLIRDELLETIRENRARRSDYPDDDRFFGDTLELKKRYGSLDTASRITGEIPWSYK